MLIGVIIFFVLMVMAQWMLLQHYHYNVLTPDVVTHLGFIRKDVSDIRDRVAQIQDRMPDLDDYHYERLLPALALLTANRPDPTPLPEPMPEPIPPRQPRRPLEGADIENVYDRVKATY